MAEIKESKKKEKKTTELVTSNPMNIKDVPVFIKEVGKKNVVCTYGSKNRLYVAYNKEVEKE